MGHIERAKSAKIGWMPQEKSTKESGKREQEENASPRLQCC